MDGLTSYSEGDEPTYVVVILDSDKEKYRCWFVVIELGEGYMKKRVFQYFRVSTTWVPVVKRK